jgi:hypothetical protein
LTTSPAKPERELRTTARNPADANGEAKSSAGTWRPLAREVLTGATETIVVVDVVVAETEAAAADLTVAAVEALLAHNTSPLPLASKVHLEPGDFPISVKRSNNPSNLFFSNSRDKHWCGDTKHLFIGSYYDPSLCNFSLRNSLLLMYQNLAMFAFRTCSVAATKTFSHI